MDSSKFFLLAASFGGTIAIFVFLVRRARFERRIYWIVFCTVASVIWLGLIKGLIASAIALAFVSGYIATRLDARRIGKRVANSMGISHNLFFSALEQTLPLYLSVLAALEREGNGVPHARQLLMPYLLQGLNVLEERFGCQPMIDAARESAKPFLSELDESNEQR